MRCFGSYEHVTHLLVAHMHLVLALFSLLLQWRQKCVGPSMASEDRRKSRYSSAICIFCSTSSKRIRDNSNSEFVSDIRSYQLAHLVCLRRGSTSSSPPEEECQHPFHRLLHLPYPRRRLNRAHHLQPDRYNDEIMRTKLKSM